jgi:methylmalonyl-CoA mutase cobalamin-binding domain/chain
MQRELQNRGLSIKWMVGGNIPEADIEAIKSTGALSAFPTGTTIQEVIDFLNKLAEIPQNPVG